MFNVYLLIKLLCGRHTVIGLWDHHGDVGYRVDDSPVGAIVAVRCVPVMVTVGPGQDRLEGVEQVVEGPGDNHIVVGGEEERYHHCRQTSSYKIQIFKLIIIITYITVHVNISFIKLSVDKQITRIQFSSMHVGFLLVIKKNCDYK